MATGKKKNKNVRTMNLNEFLQDPKSSGVGGGPVSTPTISWATQVDSVDVDGEDVIIADPAILQSLPREPKSVRGPDIDPSTIPDSGPFKIHVSNLYYEADESRVTAFFTDRNLDVKEVTLVYDSSRRMRGYGDVEFYSKNDLLLAMALNEEKLLSRSMRMTLSHGPGDRGAFRSGQDGSWGGNSERPVDSDWRRKDDQHCNPVSGGVAGRQMERDWHIKDDRPMSVGGVSGWRDGDHDVRQSYGRRQGDRYDGRRQNFRNDDNWQGFVGRREAANSNDRGFQSRLDGDYGTGPRESGHRDDYQDNRQYDDKQDRPGGAQLERPRICLKPRSTPIVPGCQAVTSRSSSIFGQAKPVDTALKELQIEEKLRVFSVGSYSNSTGQPGSDGRRCDSDSWASGGGERQDKPSGHVSDRDRDVLYPSSGRFYGSDQYQLSHRESNYQPAQLTRESAGQGQGVKGSDRHCSQQISSDGRDRRGIMGEQSGEGRSVDVHRQDREQRDGRSDVKRQQQRGRVVPKSVEEMASYDDGPAKDWTDANKFAGLLGDDDDGANRDEE